MNVHMPESAEAAPGARPPSLNPADPWVRGAVFTVIAIPLAVIIVLLVVVNAALPSSASALGGFPNGFGFGGGNGGGGYGGGSGANGYYPDTATANPYQNTYTTPDDGGYGGEPEATDTSGDGSGYGVGGPVPTPTDSPSSSGPDSTVLDYFNAINQQNYESAWTLGGDNLGESYNSFVAGFSNTAQDVVTIENVQGDDVTANLVAQNRDSTTQYFTGTYTVTNGAITHFDVQPSNG